MLRQLTINNYAIVDHLDIELKQGMTVITGETGAGKSIMLDALGLTLGDRADKEVIRDGAERADISACFQLEENREALAWMKQHDFTEGVDDECILRRVITREGRSRAYINGQPTTLNELKDLGEMLIDIHSQHEHQSLLKQSTHQRLLDEFCGHQALAEKVRHTAAQWRRLNQDLQDIRARAEDNSAQQQLISYQVQELDELALGENELDELEQEHRQLSHAESSLAVSQQALDLCSENEQFNIRQGLNQALSLLQDIPWAGKHVEEAGSLLNTALIQVEEAAAELSRSIDKYDLNPSRLEEVDQRLAAIHQIARKHRVKPSELAQLHGELKQQLEDLSDSDLRIEAMQADIDTLQQSYHEDARVLSMARGEGAKTLAAQINSQLTRLGMSGARLSIDLNSAAPDAPAGNGYDKVEFLVSTNPGQPPRALIKVASGGELSRISLAIQVVTAQTSAIPSLVFDEVDVGIGGGVARSVGELLRQLGDKGQVICVTHQPQVASQGHHHLSVSKQTDHDATITRIRELDTQARIEEVARMLGGDKLTDQSVAHAQEMMI